MKNLAKPAVFIFSVTLMVGLLGVPQALYG
jgi:hypothetical protein